MLERVLTGVVVAVHYAFLLYLIVGGFLAWKWPRTIWLHLVAAAWAVLIVTVGALCPLTFAQNWLRERQGQPPLRTGFIQQYVTGTFYPTGAERLSQLLVGVVVAVSWIGFARRRKLIRRASVS